MFKKLNHLNMSDGEEYGVSGRVSDFKNFEEFIELANKYLKNYKERNETDLLYTGFSERTAIYLTDDGEVEYGFGGFVMGMDVEEEYITHREKHYLAELY